MAKTSVIIDKNGSVYLNGKPGRLPMYDKKTAIPDGMRGRPIFTIDRCLREDFQTRMSIKLDDGKTIEAWTRLLGDSIEFYRKAHRVPNYCGVAFTEEDGDKITVYAVQIDGTWRLARPSVN